MKKSLLYLALCSAISVITLTGCPIKFDTGTIRSSKNDNDNNNVNIDDEQAFDTNEIDQQINQLKDDSEKNNKSIEQKKQAIKNISISQENHAKDMQKAISASTKDKKISGNQSSEWLMVHNALRQLHDTDGLTWSDDIAKRAKAYAETCPDGHSALAGNKYGENIAYATGKVMSPTEVVNAWYDEISMYNYDGSSHQKGTGHFTQVIWKETTKLGCGYKTGCKTGKWAEVWVCQYEKPGNNTMSGKFEKNVLPQLVKRTINPNADLKVENLSLSKKEQAQQKKQVLKHTINLPEDTDMGIKTIRNADTDIEQVESDKSWNFQEDKVNLNDSLKNQKTSDNTINNANDANETNGPTDEVIDGKRVMQGKGFTISKKVE